MRLGDGYTTISGKWGYQRRKRSQAMRTESCRVVGSRWNRPCILMDVCLPGFPCICDLPRIKVMRSRCCNRVACAFLKLCHAEAESDWRPIGYRTKWWLGMCRCPAKIAAYLQEGNIT